MENTTMQNNDLSNLGAAPNLPLGDLNLAGSHGIPDPQEVFHPTSSSGLIQPDYACPDLTMPKLSGDDPASSSLTVFAEFAPDPLIPNLAAGPRPFAVDLQNDPASSDPMLVADMPDEEDCSLLTWPGLGFDHLQVLRSVDTTDLLIPDFRHPDLQPEVVMPPDERPGDLAPDALDVMHHSLLAQYLAGKHYPEVYADQRGMNNRSSRKMTLLMQGLDAEERGKEL
jgi:hypothetical protein